jgi:hypothetical protein
MSEVKASNTENGITNCVTAQQRTPQRDEDLLLFVILFALLELLAGEIQKI